VNSLIFTFGTLKRGTDSWSKASKWDVSEIPTKLWLFVKVGNCIFHQAVKAHFMYVQILLTDEFIDEMLADISDISDVEEVLLFHFMTVDSICAALKSYIYQCFLYFSDYVI